MKTKYIATYLIALLLLLCLSGISRAFDDNVTHFDLSDKAIEQRKDGLNRYLQKLGYKEGLGTILIPPSTSGWEGLRGEFSGVFEPFDYKGDTERYAKGWSIRDILAEGARLEDTPMCRAGNHFHNPLKDWTHAGISDNENNNWSARVLNGYCQSEWPHEKIKSALTWATAISSPDGTVLKYEDYTADKKPYDWPMARKALYDSITNTTSADYRKAQLIKSMSALGHVSHLLQDMGVPAHVREGDTYEA